MADDEKRWDLTLTKKETAASVWYEIVDLLTPFVRAYLYLLAASAALIVVWALCLGFRDIFRIFTS